MLQRTPFLAAATSPTRPSAQESAPYLRCRPRRNDMCAPQCQSVAAGVYTRRMKATPASPRILTFNIRRSLALLRNSHLRRYGLRRLLGGINFVQALEFRLALDHLAFTGSERVLDVASPKLLAAWLASSGKVASIVMTDLSDPRLEDFRALVPPEQQHRVSCRNLDATALDQTFAAASFDRVYC